MTPNINEGECCFARSTTDIDGPHDSCKLFIRSAPWQYARSPIPSVCRALGAFLCASFDRYLIAIALLSTSEGKLTLAPYIL